MNANPMTALWARTGLIWFMLTMSFGLYIGVTQQFGFSSPHAHLGLLGWLSSIAFAFLYSASRDAEGLARFGRIHWLTHNIGVVVMVTALFMELKTGNGALGMYIGLGGLIVILSTIALAIMLWPRLGYRAA